LPIHLRPRSATPSLSRQRRDLPADHKESDLPAVSQLSSIHFDLADSPDGGTDLRWTLHHDEPVPDASAVGHLRKRLNELINANLRYTFGQ
jgi:hypothetical protein